MGMTCYLQQITPERLEAVKNDSSLLPSVINSEENPEEPLDIDKTWQGIHFLLTGEVGGGDPPLANALLGGTVFENASDYIFASFLTSDEVKEVTEALRGISEKELKDRFNTEEMNELKLYPSFNNWIDDDFDYLLGNYKDMVDYYKSAAEKGNPMLVYIL
ncbi:YfbM family protein [Paenactinomyces guangxiensis]|uniref:YfbM family protein n=1 Tax=Paenactinomyces guangxiensis TaxID=1490290 RepID=A0A7W1WR00_9BACL|nr:YfbM family protein [Paenactinomyces guangxiensis]MBA4494261.1 YfbM family protein [Paenactinomyces guangxiensis]MBH8590757.1 YfbM family protein [Paenactinomyces guangxiensis]